jgi:hypothetical protein
MRVHADDENGKIQKLLYGPSTRSLRLGSIAISSCVAARLMTTQVPTTEARFEAIVQGFYCRPWSA